MHTCSIFFQDYGGILFERKYKRTMLRAIFLSESTVETRNPSNVQHNEIVVLLAKSAGYIFNVLYLHLAYTHKSTDNKRPCFKHKFHNSDPVSHLSSAITSQLSAKKTNPFICIMRRPVKKKHEQGLQDPLIANLPDFRSKQASSKQLSNEHQKFLCTSRGARLRISGIMATSLASLWSFFPLHDFYYKG